MVKLTECKLSRARLAHSAATVLRRRLAGSAAAVLRRPRCVRLPQCSRTRACAASQLPLSHTICAGCKRPTPPELAQVGHSSAPPAPSAQLCEALRANTTVISLDLSANHFTDEGERQGGCLGLAGSVWCAACCLRAGALCGRQEHWPHTNVLAMIGKSSSWWAQHHGACTCSACCCSWLGACFPPLIVLLPLHSTLPQCRRQGARSRAA